jgi:hypothetical protein
LTAILAVLGLTGMAKAQQVQQGHYKCFFNDYPRGMSQSSIGNFTLTGNKYQEDVFANGNTGHSSGTFEFTPMPKGEQTGKLTFHGGLLNGHWAYSQYRPSNKQIAIVWPNNESEKAWDRGATWCYYDPKG